MIEDDNNDVAQIDAQGHDFQVLKGATELLNGRRVRWVAKQQGKRSGRGEEEKEKKKDEDKDKDGRTRRGRREVDREEGEGGWKREKEAETMRVCVFC